jgi:oxygen-independent coproporphyrinogen-3 oxidase
VSSAELADGYEFSFEGHPNNTTESHLQTLFDLGFRRVSFGVQDYNPIIQKAIHRIQPFENVKRVTELARSIGYTSIGHDLIFGLPFQTEADVIQTINYTQQLKPDRIAFYSYAHVPWIKGNGQRGFKDSDLPSAESKRAQYQNGKQLLEDIGYVEIGMDHFALKTDSLFLADENKQLHRNFMGYTASRTTVMIGLGVSSISDCWTGFAQNEKNLEDYQERIQNNELPIFRGHLLNSEDIIIRQHILNLMCKFETYWENSSLYFKEVTDVLVALKTFEEDGLINLDTYSVVVHPKGRPFIRNICMAFDLRLQRKKPDMQLFSMTI